MPPAWVGKFNFLRLLLGFAFILYYNDDRQTIINKKVKKVIGKTANEGIIRKMGTYNEKLEATIYLHTIGESTESWIMHLYNILIYM